MPRSGGHVVVVRSRVLKVLQAEVLETGAKRDTRGRRIATAEERAALIRAYEEGGMPQRVFAQQEGVKFCMFTTSWRAIAESGRSKCLRR